MSIKKQIKQALKWVLWFCSVPALLTIVMVPEQPIFLIPVIGAMIWMTGSTICTKIDEDREERR